MIKIAPSILTADFLNLGNQLLEAEQGSIDYIHLDVMDGVFVPNISFGPLVVEAIKKQTKLVLDVHLMIVNPEKYIEKFAQAGANIITVHYETCTHLHRTIELIKSFGCKAGVAINPATPVDLLQDILFDIDLALIMSVNPGFGGQKFILNSLKKITQINNLKKTYNLNLEIEVDGGVTKDNIKSIYDAGANVVVAGSSVFNKNSIKENIKLLKQF